MLPATRPLQGRYVRLEPFVPEHLPGLRTALMHPEVFAGGYGGGPAGLPSDDDAFDQWISGYGVAPDAIRFVARLVRGPHDGEIVGASTLGDLNAELGYGHIGWTGWDPRVWGTQVNPEAKLLMLEHAFDAGLVRVQLQADSGNDRSRGALLKLGATFEGVLRDHRRRADGELSGTAVFSVLAAEWPAVRRGLQERLDGWGGEPVRLREPKAADPGTTAG